MGGRSERYQEEFGLVYLSHILLVSASQAFRVAD